MALVDELNCHMILRDWGEVRQVELNLVGNPEFVEDLIAPGCGRAERGRELNQLVGVVGVGSEKVGVRWSATHDHVVTIVGVGKEGGANFGMSNRIQKSTEVLLRLGELDTGHRGGLMERSTRSVT